MWALFESNDGWCIVHHKNILQVGPIEVDEVYTYFYNGKQYEGKVLCQNESRDTVDQELSKVKAAKDATKSSKRRTQESDLELPSKRKVKPVTFYGAIAGCSSASSNNIKAISISNKTKSASKMTDEQARRQRILNLNLKESQKHSKAAVPSKAKSNAPANEKDDDSDWVMDDESEDSVVDDVLAHGLAAKQNRSNLLKTINDARSQSGTSSSSAAGKQSPSKEELKRQNELLQIKLQMLYDREDTPHGDKAKNDVQAKLKESAATTFSENHVDMSLEIEDDAIASNANLDKSDSKRTDDEFEDMLPEGHGDERLEYQLYGNQEGTPHLGRNIYCKTDVLTKALTNSNSVNHLIRRLIVGVYKPSQLVNCSVTGQSWRAGGPEKAKEVKMPLHQSALRGIVDFANGVAKRKKWPTKRFDKAKPVISGRLIEIKKQVREGHLKD